MDKIILLTFLSSFASVFALMRASFWNESLHNKKGE